MKVLKNYQSVFIILFFLLLSAITPLSGDDWTWRTHVGMDRLKSFFYDYNGRYISNIIEIIFVRSSFIRVIGMTIFSSLLILLMSRLAYKKRALQKSIVTLIIVMLMPTQIFAETFGWVAGYVNYVTSAVAMLYFVLLGQAIVNRQWKVTPLNVVLNIILAILSMLLVEHVSLYLLFVTVYFSIIYYLKYKRISKYLVYGFVSLFIGAIAMFSNKAYYSIATAKDAYRTVGTDQGLFNAMLDIYYTHNMYLIPLIFLACVYVAKKLNRIDKVNVILLLGMFLGTVYLFFNHRNLEVPHPSMTHIVAGILFIIYLGAFIGFALYNFYQTSRFDMLVLYALSTFVCTVPFFFITPYGGRTALASLIFVLLIVLTMVDEVTPDVTFTYSNWINVGLIVTLVVTILLPIGENKKTETERTQIVEHLPKNTKTVELPGLPYPQFHHMGDPTENTYMTPFFKLYYGIDYKKTKFIIKTHYH